MMVAAPAAALPVELSGNMRHRVEGIANQVRPGFERDEALWNIRTTLSATAGDGPIKAQAELVDSRVYDAGPRTAAGTNEVNAVELVQAWIVADLDNPFGAGTKGRVQAGRFLIDIGSRRLVANEDYRNTTNGFTGLRSDLSGRGWSATLFYTLPQVRLPADLPSIRRNRVELDRESFDLRFAGALLGTDALGGGLKADAGLYRLDERDRADLPTRNRHLTTLSARVFRAPAPATWHFEVEGIRQTGRIRASAAPTAAQLPVRAWFAHASLGYTFAHPWQPRLTFEYDHASGDRPGGAYNRFDSLFGMRRPDLGPAGLYFAIGRTNIISPALRLEATPSKRLDAFIAWRELWLASRTDIFSTTGVRDPAGRSGRYAGSEFDGRVRWWAIPQRLRLEANATYLRKGRFLIAAPNAPVGGDTRYYSLNGSIFF
ncbi:alginate export family protein [Sphingomonas sp. ID1715]|uniref:alginate export family protein n=1 Tax=Sphingomonas sp. ID1715 TaxID=1656898 RepID=UPI0020C52A2F|nr:alginate export family protein [Sphingomonas sp. ID1715]